MILENIYGSLNKNYQKDFFYMFTPLMIASLHRQFCIYVKLNVREPCVGIVKFP